jgi:hypothetical protein
MLSHPSEFQVFFTGALPPEPGVIVSSVSIRSLLPPNAHNGFATGDFFVVVNPSSVPEPGLLGIVGTGLIGLAGLVRRKLKLLT